MEARTLTRGGCIRPMKIPAEREVPGINGAFTGACACMSHAESAEPRGLRFSRVVRRPKRRDGPDVERTDRPDVRHRRQPEGDVEPPLETSIASDDDRWTLTFGGRGVRTVPVLGWSAGRLTAYAEAMEPLRPADRIFTRASAPIGGALVIKELCRRSKVIGLSPVATPTTIRHACIRDLIDAGMAVCTENPIRVADVMESPKLAE